MRHFVVIYSSDNDLIVYLRRELMIACLTSSYASSITLLPIPTICSEGRPFVASLYTSVKWLPNPTGAAGITLETADILSVIKRIWYRSVNMVY